MRRWREAAVELGLIVALVGCGAPQEMRIAWSPAPELSADLPRGISVRVGADPSIPLRAWTVRVDGDAPNLRVHVAAAGDPERLEPVSAIAARVGAVVAVNAGYYRVDQERPSHIGLLLVDRVLLRSPLTSVIRDERRYYLARAALGIDAAGKVDVAWVSSRQGVLYEWPQPPHNAPGSPVEEIDLSGLGVWQVVDAVAAGPALIVDGEIRITSDQEVFFDSPVLGVNPRTAAGITGDGDLVLVVVDGRQRDSRGVDLLELATLMRDLGCVEALNLDGGGSSTLVVNGRLVNRPGGTDLERKVMSVLAVTTN